MGILCRFMPTYIEMILTPEIKTQVERVSSVSACEPMSELVWLKG